MMAKMGTTREKMMLILLLFVCCPPHRLTCDADEEASMGAAADEDPCKNFPVVCYIKCLRPGGCNKCCKAAGFLRGECVGWDCYCCRGEASDV
ncbi:hypothetical protein SETIT_2G055000v2 [Setaria italica]|uniref:Knottin scorpion toxin-like domain-containing protein n=1 Tax=Setaria italica TaxID=4555 RepID=A0A368PWE0_SETIT|nr:hypothetical protein SETIT_2G055000v2 [Setaria italica]